MQDPLSDILAVVAAHSSVSTALVAGGAWALRVHQYSGLKFNAVLRGQAWLMLDGAPDGAAPPPPLHLHAGDCFVLTAGTGFVIASDPAPATAAREAAEVYANLVDGVARMGQGDDFHVIGGKMVFDEADAGLLLDGLPPLIHIAADSPRAANLQWLLVRLMEELGETQPGRAVVADQLMHMMFIESLRAYLASGAARRDGWIGALADSRIRAAVHAIHGAPAQRWTLAALASVACMSRSHFAQQFKAAVGVAPLDYVLKWRMRLACRALRRGDQAVSAIAASLGYGSDSAFSNAFKRNQGESPLAYRKRMA